ncbi:hypothetical protein IF2G_01832 [Cordyceps javanica]|nr:hypothetical protein IF2G_01832 [Cordyceps javanica]
MGVRAGQSYSPCRFGVQGRAGLHTSEPARQIDANGGMHLHQQLSPGLPSARILPFCRPRRVFEPPASTIASNLMQWTGSTARTVEYPTDGPGIPSRDHSHTVVSVALYSLRNCSLLQSRHSL